MGALVAILQNDPNLLPCQVLRLSERVAMAEPSRLPDAYGYGYFRGNDVLLGKRPSGAASALSLAGLAGGVESEALLVQGRYATVGGTQDENTPPYRFRRWLFAHDGTVEGFAALKPQLLASLPEFLRRNIHGDTDSEHAFMVFLRRLREVGALDDLEAEAQAVARALAHTVRDLVGWARESGANGASGLNLVATNGRVLAAVRSGGPLHYALLEGILPCARDGLAAHAPDSDPRLRPHRQVKAVCLATRLLDPAGFVEVPDGSTLAVSRSLQVTVTGLGAE